jgi:exopolysaccharide biosynthesis polyprenyl glycosylphosphotransferase
MADSPNRWQFQISERRFLLIIGDMLVILLAVLISLLIWLVMDGRDLGMRFVLLRFYWYPILALLWLALASANDLYNLRIAARVDASLLKLVQVMLQVLVVYLVIFFFSPRDALPRLFILYYTVSSFLLLAIWRGWHPFLFGWTDTRRRAVIVGAGWTALTIIETLNHEAPDLYDLVGLIIEPEETLPGITAVPVIGHPKNLSTIVVRENITEVILATGRDLSGPMFQALLDCYELGITIMPMPLLYEQVTGRVPVEHVGQQYWMAMLPVDQESRFDIYLLLKRGMDILFAIIGLLLFAFLLPLIALASHLDSHGPIFFRQWRLGKGGRLFQVYKLRTMIRDAEHDTGPLWAREDDPRITRVGRWLRRTRLDEVPQLVNVLRGEMSLIGPRPERPEFVLALSATIPFYRARHVVKPGITGWAQVRYGYGSTEEDALIKLQYDLYYIRHRSLALDILILLRTAGRILSLQGI